MGKFWEGNKKEQASEGGPYRQLTAVSGIPEKKLSEQLREKSSNAVPDTNFIWKMFTDKADEAAAVGEKKVEFLSTKIKGFDSKLSQAFLKRLHGEGFKVRYIEDQYDKSIVWFVNWE